MSDGNVAKLEGDVDMILPATEIGEQLLRLADLSRFSGRSRNEHLVISIV